MSERIDYIWLFFGTKGRLSRYPFFLAGMLLSVLVSIPLYKFLMANQTFWQGGMFELENWRTISQIAVLAALWPMYAISAKRFQDFGQPGMFGVVAVVPVLSLLSFPLLCLYPGDRGANRYGERTNAKP